MVATKSTVREALIGPSDATAGFSSEENDDILVTWNQVQTRIIQLTGGDPKNVRDNLSIDDVLNSLDHAQKSDKKAAAKYGEIKKVFNNSLKCIQTVGDIVANGASQVS
jgi:fungal STAND N-terminal Goodbye domain